MAYLVVHTTKYPKYLVDCWVLVAKQRKNAKEMAFTTLLKSVAMATVTHLSIQ